MSLVFFGSSLYFAPGLYSSSVAAGPGLNVFVSLSVVL